MKSSSVSNYIQRDGFVMVSNLLIAYQMELGLTNRELVFIIKAIKHKENYKLHDDQLDPSVSSRTLQRCRKSLKEKGYLNYKIWKYSDEKGRLHTEGITYDFSPLEEELQRISNLIAEEKESQINKEAENYIIEYGEESPIVKFMEDWENHYGDKYRLTPVEKQWYNKLSEEEQEYVSRIFEFCEDMQLFKEITPRLILFIKTASRWKQLKEYVNDNPKENIVSCLDETEEPVIVEPKKIKIDKKLIIEKEIERAKKALAGNLDDIQKMVWEDYLKDKLEELKEIGEQ
jgi:hypothetical protein